MNSGQDFIGRKIDVVRSTVDRTPSVSVHPTTIKGNKQRRQAAQISKIAAEYLALQGEEAKDAGALGYIGRCVVQATLPHSDPAPEYSFERRNGSYVFSITAPKSIGLPYGVFPRLILIWISSEVVRTQEPRLLLGEHLSHFMRQLGVTPSGGPRGPITYLRDQMKRLFSSTIQFTASDQDQDQGSGCLIAEDYKLWWKPRAIDEQKELWQSWVELSDKLFIELKNFSVPIDLRRVKLLRRSPLALDIYTWWTYRFSYLRRQTEVPWEALYLQFGASYETMFHFKEAFRAALAKAHQAYPEANVNEGKHGLILKPSRTSVPKLPVLPAIASDERVKQWTERHNRNYRQFLRELEALKEASIGAPIGDPDAAAIRAADLASRRADVPLDIAYNLLGVKRLD